MTAQPEAPLVEAADQAQTVKQAAPRAEDIKLDRGAFTETLKLKALRVPTARCQELMKRFTGCGPHITIGSMKPLRGMCQCWVAQQCCAS